ncbi:MAG: FAD-binding oxidoreductase [Candidatus Longimicrobiales bacterium M2_2A_002]
MRTTVETGPTVIRPGDDGYDEARGIWNGMIDRRPAEVVRCGTPADVAAAIRSARSRGLPLAVRGGGHNVAGFGTVDDGMVIDLGPMAGVEVDPGSGTVTADGGARLADLDAATQAHGLVVPSGVVSDTGVAGLTLGGGMGWLRGKWGLTCDNLIGAEVVLADGRVVWTDESERPELLWALRGGGGNFGVVTRLRFRAYALGPEVAFAFVFHDGRGDGMRDAVRRFRDFCASTPDEISPLLALGRVPPGADALPAELEGTPFALIGAMYAGPAEAGEEALSPLRTFAEPLADFSGRMPYVEAQQVFDDDYPARELRYYWKSTNLPALDDGLIDIIVEHARRQPSPLSTTDLWHVGGAVARTADESAAYAGRDIAFLLNPEANWRDPADDEVNIRWARELLAAVSEHADDRMYLNFPGLHEGGADTMRRTYGSKYERVLAIKRRYDPENVFRRNQNIEP